MDHIKERIESDYYSIEEISEIILVDSEDILKAIKNKGIYDEEFQINCENKIIDNDEEKYHYEIIKKLDEIINDMFMARYKKRYQEEITEPFNILVEKHNKKKKE